VIGSTMKQFAGLAGPRTTPLAHSQTALKAGYPRLSKRFARPFVAAVLVSLFAAWPALAANDAAIRAQEVADVINAETGGTNFIETYAAGHGGCALFEFAQREFAGGRPWGKPFEEWTAADVAVFRYSGRKCIDSDPRNDTEQRRVLTNSFNMQYEHLEQEAEAARAEAGAGQEASSLTAEDDNQDPAVEPKLADERALSETSDLLISTTPLGAVSLDLLRRVKPQVREIPDQREAAMVGTEAGHTAASVADQLRQWLRDYQSMAVPEALAAANQLLAKAEALSGADYTTEIWDLTSEVMDKRYELETAAESTSQHAIRPACYAALSKAGYNHDWSQYPVWFDDPDFNMGDFLCWFLRTGALGSVAVGNNWAEVVVNDGTLRFEPRKLIDSDDYYADPSSKAAGQVKLAIVAASLNGQTDRLITFTQHIKAISVIMTYQGAPFVE
jgi:hypothetical protein